MSERIDSASKLIHASPSTVYEAFIDPESIVRWLPPTGMTGEIYQFEPREGGVFRIALRYEARTESGRGKTTENTDVVESVFRKIVPNRQIVTCVTFQSDDPTYAGEMEMTWDLRPETNGSTYVSIICRNVPDGIRPEDHDAGLRSTLENLAAFVESSG